MVMLVNNMVFGCFFLLLHGLGLMLLPGFDWRSFGSDGREGNSSKNSSDQYR